MESPFLPNRALKLPQGQARVTKLNSAISVIFSVCVER